MVARDPPFILTSIHSVEEDTEGHGTYNRLVSTEDGHSMKWQHYNKYSECSKVCFMEYEVDPSKVEEVMAELRKDIAVASIIEPLDDATLRKLVEGFARFHLVDREVPKDDRDTLNTHLMGYVSKGSFGDAEPQASSCMIHIDFKRRFGTGRAACLK